MFKAVYIKKRDYEHIENSNRKKGNKRQYPVSIISGNMKNYRNKNQHYKDNTPKMKYGGYKNPQGSIKYFFFGFF